MLTAPARATANGGASNAFAPPGRLPGIVRGADLLAGRPLFTCWLWPPAAAAAYYLAAEPVEPRG